MTDLYSQIYHFNPHHAEGMIDFIEGNTTDNVHDLDAEIHDFDTCIVGEIHNFDSTYAYELDNQDDLEPSELYCEDCKRFADELSIRFNEDDRGMFTELVISFYDHVRSKH